MFLDMRSRAKDKTSSLLYRVLLIAAGAVVATGASVAVMGLASIRVLSGRVADAIYGMYGGLAAGPSGLLDSSGKEIAGKGEVVDTLKRELLLEASIYAPKDGTYECVSTSLRQADGSRALGSTLSWKPDDGADEPAIARGRSLVPLKRTTELIALAESEGDLTSRVETAAQDETGTLARSLRSRAASRS